MHLKQDRERKRLLRGRGGGGGEGHDEDPVDSPVGRGAGFRLHVHA